MFTTLNFKSNPKSSAFKKPILPKMPSRKVKNSNAKQTVQPEPLPESDSPASDTVFSKEELNLSANEKSAEEKTTDEKSGEENSADEESVNDDEDTDEEEPQYEIESIAYHYPLKAKSSNKCTHYSIKWVGYDSTENTKETAAKIYKLVPELVDEYWVNVKKSTEKKSVSKNLLRLKSQPRKKENEGKLAMILTKIRRLD
jgi:hypothetical protein